MIIGNKSSLIRLMIWQWKFMVLSLGTSTLACVLYIVLEQKWVILPALPLSVIGAAMGIFVSFRTNSAYDRWWEGRKLWGRLINTSRHFCLQSLRYFPSDEHETFRKRLVRRHIAYVHTLRCALRNESVLEDDVFQQYTDDDDRQALHGSTNINARLLDVQLHELTNAADAGTLSEFRLQDFDETIRHLFDIQGGCERIKKTPLPKIYGIFSEQMIFGFCALVPLGMVSELGWATIPVTILVTLGFKMISETGRVLEDPFNNFYNALPLMALSNTIERNLLELMGESDLPPPTAPIAKGNVIM